MSLDVYKNEIWKEIKFDFPGELIPKYEVSNLGRIKSYAINKNQGQVIKGGKVGAYRTLTLRLSTGKAKTYYVHRLVAKYFLEKQYADDKCVIHLDFDKTNNSIYNLECVTHHEQILHSRKSPLRPKDQITYSKITESEVRAIKRLVSTGKTRLSIIAKRFGITHTQLNRIRSGENWGHVEI